MSPPEVAAHSVFLALLLSLALIDVRRHILPNVLVYPGIVGVMIAAPLLPAGGYIEAAIGGVTAFALFAALFFWRPNAMGAGDVKLAALVGAALGIHVAAGLVIASLLAAVVAIAMLAVGRWTRNSRIAYGPYICAGAAVVAVLVAV